VALHEIDVDQGAATLVETPCGTVMIDAGGRQDAGDTRLLAYLKGYFAARPALNNTLPAVFLTHPHIDHDLGLLDVVHTYKVGGVIYNGQSPAPPGPGKSRADAVVAYATAHHIPTRGVLQADAFNGDGVTDDVVSPLAGCTGVKPEIRVLGGGHSKDKTGWTGDYKNPNNNSLAIRVDYGKASFLFLGDMEEAQQAEVIAHWSGTPWLRADVYHVAHHGSYNGTTPATMSAVAPKIAVMGVGAAANHAQWTAWAYGHPREQAIQAMEAGVSDHRDTPKAFPISTAVKTFHPETIDKAIYATGWDGDITITADKDGTYVVTTEPVTHPPDPPKAKTAAAAPKAHVTAGR